MVLLAIVVSRAYLMMSSQEQILICCDEILKFSVEGSLSVETGLSSESEGGEW